MTEKKDGMEHAPEKQHDVAKSREPNADPATEPSSALHFAASAGNDDAAEEPRASASGAENDADAADAGATEDASSAFDGQAKDADALWASLGAADSEPEGERARSESEEGPDENPDGAEDEDDSEDDSELVVDGAAFAAQEEAAAAEKKVKQVKKAAFGKGPFNGKTFGPIVPARAFAVDEDGVLAPTPPTIASRLFSGLALIPLLLPVALLVAQVLFTFDVRALWYSDEVRYADAFRNMVESSDWLVLHLNGAVYPDKPPLFFWFLYGINEAAAQVLPGGLPQPMLFFVGVAVSGLLCLLASHALASLVGRVDRRTVLAADLILISGFFFAGLLHYLRMDVLFAAFITLSHVLLFHAWVREKAPLLMLLGFLSAGAAVLVKGPLGFAFPLLAGLCFLTWQGRLLRFFRLDSIFGIIAGLAVPGVWLALAWMNMGDAFLDNILHKQVLARALNTWHHAEPWHHYLMTFPLIWLPWTLLFLFLPWGRLFGKGMREGVKASRGKDGAGIAYLWCAFLPGFILLSAVSIKLPIYCLPLFPPLAILCARAVLQMRPLATACFQYTLALFLAVLGLSLILIPMAPKELLRLPALPEGTILAGGVCLVFACALGFLVRPRRAEGLILLTALFTTAFSYPVWSLTAPSLDVFLSPKAQAEVVKKYRDAGYYPASFKVYPGTYSYYAGNVETCNSWEDALAVTQKHEKALLALRASFWDKLENKPQGFAEVNRQTIAERDYVLVARPPLDGPKETPPAPAENSESPVSTPADMQPEAKPEVSETPPANAETQTGTDAAQTAAGVAAEPSEARPEPGSPEASAEPQGAQPDETGEDKK